MKDDQKLYRQRLSGFGAFVASLHEKAKAKKAKQAAAAINNENNKNFTFHKSLTVKENRCATKKPSKIVNTKEEQIDKQRVDAQIKNIDDRPSLENGVKLNSEQLRC